MLRARSDGSSHYWSIERKRPARATKEPRRRWLIFDAQVAEAICDLRVGADIVVLSWLDRASRDVLSTHPRGDKEGPLVGVFSTRSPDRPNPIGLHRVQILGRRWPADSCSQPRSPQRNADPRCQTGPRASRRTIALRTCDDTRAAAQPSVSQSRLCFNPLSGCHRRQTRVGARAGTVP